VSSIDAFYDSQMEVLSVTADMVRRHTRTDPELSQVYEFLQVGWPKTVPDNLQPYFRRRHELSSSQGCLIWGTFVVIPHALRQKIITELHSGHLGIVYMKNVARSFVWWPKLDTELEVIAKQCNGCIQSRNMPATTVHQCRDQLDRGNVFISTSLDQCQDTCS